MSAVTQGRGLSERQTQATKSESRGEEIQEGLRKSRWPEAEEEVTGQMR